MCKGNGKIIACQKCIMRKYLISFNNYKLLRMCLEIDFLVISEKMYKKNIKKKIKDNKVDFLTKTFSSPKHFLSFYVLSPNINKNKNTWTPLSQPIKKMTAHHHCHILPAWKKQKTRLTIYIYHFMTYFIIIKLQIIYPSKNKKIKKSKIKTSLSHGNSQYFFLQIYSQNDAVD